jgi:hypothetical protein
VTPHLLKLACGALLALSSLGTAFARSEFKPGENLLASIPDDWGFAHSDERERIRLYEYVPKPQTVEGWTRMITIEAHRLDAQPVDFVRRMGASFKARCPKTETFRDSQPDIDGRPAVRFFFRIPECTGIVPESDLVLAIRGREALYVILHAWRPAPPTKQEFLEANALLNGVRVCDTAAGTCETLKAVVDNYRHGHTSQRTLWQRSMSGAQDAFARNRYDEAQRLFQDAFVEAQRLSPNDETVRSTLLALAQLYRAQGREQDAALMERRAEAIRAE